MFQTLVLEWLYYWFLLYTRNLCISKPIEIVVFWTIRPDKFSCILMYLSVMRYKDLRNRRPPPYNLLHFNREKAPVSFQKHGTIFRNHPVFFYAFRARWKKPEMGIFSHTRIRVARLKQFHFSALPFTHEYINLIFRLIQVNKRRIFAFTVGEYKRVKPSHASFYPSTS